MTVQVYITRYALSGGILGPFECDAPRAGERYVCIRRPGYLLQTETLGTTAFESLDDARADAEYRRVKKIASLKRQITKLDNLKF